MFIKSNDVPGVVIPDTIMKRMENAQQSGNEEQEGVQIALELMEKVRALGDMRGFHIMNMRCEEVIHRLVKEAGLMKRREMSNRSTREELQSTLEAPQL